jgi:hypothetical protein
VAADQSQVRWNREENSVHAAMLTASEVWYEWVKGLLLVHNKLQKEKFILQVTKRRETLIVYGSGLEEVA